MYWNELIECHANKKIEQQLIQWSDSIFSSLSKEERKSNQSKRTRSLVTNTFIFLQYFMATLWNRFSHELRQSAFKSKRIIRNWCNVPPFSPFSFKNGKLFHDFLNFSHKNWTQYAMNSHKKKKNVVWDILFSTPEFEQRRNFCWEGGKTVKILFRYTNLCVLIFFYCNIVIKKRC